MKKALFGIAGTLGMLVFPGAAGTAAAQSPIPLAIEVRADAAFPMGGFADQTRTGRGFGVNAAVELFPNYALYGGYSRTTFDLETPNATAIDDGFAVGLTAAYPFFGTAIMPYLGTGLIFHNLRVEGAEVPAGDSGIGYEVGTGLAIAVMPRIRLTPGIGYRRYTAPFINQPDAVISYGSAGIGLNVAF